MRISENSDLFRDFLTSFQSISQLSLFFDWMNMCQCLNELVALYKRV